MTTTFFKKAVILYLLYSIGVMFALIVMFILLFFVTYQTGPHLVTVNDYGEADSELWMIITATPGMIYNAWIIIKGLIRL